MNDPSSVVAVNGYFENFGKPVLGLRKMALRVLNEQEIGHIAGGSRQAVSVPDHEMSSACSRVCL